MKFTGIKPRIFLVFSSLTIVMLSVVAILGYKTARQSYEQQSITHTEVLCRLLAEKLEARYLDYIQDRPQNQAYNYFFQILQGEMAAMDLTNAFIFDSALNIHVDVNQLISPADLAINGMEIRNLHMSKYSATLPFKADDGNWYLWAFYRITPNWYLGIQESAERMSVMDQLAYSFIFIGVIGILLTFIAAGYIARSITRPVDRLVDFSARIGEGFFEDTPPSQLKDELGILQTALVKMRTALKSKQEENEQMLAQIAHEIRNPLGGIELIAGLLKEDLSGKQKQQEYLDKILGEVHILKIQINDFLNYARPSAANPQDVVLNDIYQEIEFGLKNKLEQKTIILEAKFDQPSLLFDRRHLKQILLNLVSNSIDAVDEGGKIRLDSGKNHKGVYLAISDSGPGIQKDLLDTVFKAFMTTKEDGAGLGLAICKKLCYENNATIKIENSPEYDSIIKIDLDVEM